MIVAALTVGYVSAADTADVAILPMPAVEETVDMTTGGEGDAAVEEAADPEAAEPEAAADVAETEPATDSTVETFGDSSGGQELPVAGWTEEEIAALRELAQERIRAKEALAELEKLHGDINAYLERLWTDRIEPFIKEFNPEHGHHERGEHRHRSHKERMLNALDRWLARKDLPQREEWAEIWDELVRRLADSTGIAVEEAMEIGSEWLEEQREIFAGVLEELEERREEQETNEQQVSEPLVGRRHGS